MRKESDAMLSYQEVCFSPVFFVSYNCLECIRSGNEYWEINDTRDDGSSRLYDDSVSALLDYDAYSRRRLIFYALQASGKTPYD